MQTKRRFLPDGLGLVMSAAAIWGTIGVATQGIYTVDSTTPLFINLSRMLLATPILLLACWWVVGAKTFAVSRRDLLIMAVSGMLLGISQASYFAAVRATGVTIATLITVCLSPLLVTGLSVLLRFEKVTQKLILALVLALIGTVLLVGVESPDPNYDLGAGILYSLLSAITYAGMIICGRFLANARYHALQVTAISFIFGTALLAVINLVTGAVVIQTGTGALLVVYLAIVPTALAYLLFQMGLRTVSATTASVITLLEPAVASVLAWWLFNEQLAPSGLLGAALLMLSIFLLSVGQESEAIPAEV